MNLTIARLALRALTGQKRGLVLLALPVLLVALAGTLPNASENGFIAYLWALRLCRGERLECAPTPPENRPGWHVARNHRRLDGSVFVGADSIRPASGMPPRVPRMGSDKGPLPVHPRVYRYMSSISKR